MWYNATRNHRWRYPRPTSWTRLLEPIEPRGVEGSSVTPRLTKWIVGHQQSSTLAPPTMATRVTARSATEGVTVNRRPQMPARRNSSARPSSATLRPVRRRSRTIRRPDHSCCQWLSSDADQRSGVPDHRPGRRLLRPDHEWYHRRARHGHGRTRRRGPGIHLGAVYATPGPGPTSPTTTAAPTIKCPSGAGELCL